ncbi:capsular biosynthesis protein [Paenibacillus swuensis]|uniref:Capsular biosynthesis protein n=1 Tax=Paenibacillus swuensis TaxID=1178515 RepID=A0A172TH20_9BACL|nr:EpsG family protein [Paenibacillus swuensis]ANE46256.1 capsular biosynthesis protein [Paenibacillus swuensis]
MTMLWLNLSLAYGFSVVARYFSRPSAVVPYVKPQPLLVFCVMASLVIIAGLRNNIGDTFFYMHSYKQHFFTWQNIDYTGDFGFNLFQMLLQQLSKDPQLLVFTTALITNVIIVLVLYYYTRWFEISIFVYITGGMFLTSMNGIRQFMAAAILFAATKFLLEGSFKKYMFVVLLAATVHKTALILIPIYFMVRRKAWTWQTLVLLIAAIVIVAGFNQFSSILFAVIEDTQYGGYSTFQEGGANLIRVLVNAVPLLIAFWGRDTLAKAYVHSDIIVNMALLGFVFMLISTQNWIFARFSIYFGLYQLILISWIFQVFRDKDRKVVYYGIIICYFIYYFYECVISLGIEYKSDLLMLG